MRTILAAWCVAICCMAHAATPTLSDKVEKVALRELDVYRQSAMATAPTPAQRQQIDAAVAAAKERTAAVRRKLDARELTADRASEQMALVAEDLLLSIHGILDPRQFKTFKQKLDGAPRLKLSQIDTRLLEAMKASLDTVGLSEAQRQRADKVFADFQSRFDDGYMQYLDGKFNEQAWQARGSALTRQLIDDCVALMEPPQQATWALLMAGDFAAPRILRSLEQFGLSPQQKTTLDERFKAFKVDYEVLRADFAAGKVDAPTFKQKAQERLRGFVEASQQVLTPEQRKAWEDAINRSQKAN